MSADRRPLSPAGERSLIERLGREGYFLREARLSETASLLAVLAWGLALVFLSGSPVNGMQPLVVNLGPVWWRYSLFGDLAILLAVFRYCNSIEGQGQRLALGLLGLLAVAHGLTSWHDPWGAVFSNTLIEWLLLLSALVTILPFLQKIGTTIDWCMAGAFAVGAILVALSSFGVHALSLAGLAARRLVVKLVAGAGAGSLLPVYRWGLALSAISLIFLTLRLRRRRLALDPGLGALRKRALLEHEGKRKWHHLWVVLVLLCIPSGGGLRARSVSLDRMLTNDGISRADLARAYAGLGRSGNRYRFEAVTNLVLYEEPPAVRGADPLFQEAIVQEIRNALLTNGTAWARARLAGQEALPQWMTALLLGEAALKAGERDAAARAFVSCLVLQPGEHRAWDGLAAAGRDPLRFVFPVRARAVSRFPDEVVIQYDAGLMAIQERYLWMSYALARALFRFEGLWKDGTGTGDWYEESFEEHLFAWRVVAAVWRGYDKDPLKGAAPFFTRLASLDRDGLLPGLVWFELWHPVSPKVAEAVRIRFRLAIERYCERILLRKYGESGPDGS